MRSKERPSNYQYATVVGLVFIGLLTGCGCFPAKAVEPSVTPEPIPSSTPTISPTPIFPSMEPTPQPTPEPQPTITPVVVNGWERLAISYECLDPKHTPRESTARLPDDHFSATLNLEVRPELCEPLCDPDKVCFIMGSFVTTDTRDVITGADIRAIEANLLDFAQ